MTRQKVQSEAARFLRHALAPLATVAVAEGWIDQSDHLSAVEAGALALSYIVAYGWSKWREHG